MRTMSEIKKEIKQLEEKIEEKRKEMLSHPDHIRDTFRFHAEDFLKERVDVLDKLTDSLEWIDNTCGEHYSRKNPIPYHGFRYKFKDDENIYEWRSGHNWCSEFMSCDSIDKIDNNWLESKDYPYNVFEDSGEEGEEQYVDVVLEKPKHFQIMYFMAEW